MGLKKSSETNWLTGHVHPLSTVTVATAPKVH